MDIKALTDGMSLIATAIATLKQVKDLLPESSEKGEAAAALEQAEQQFKIAEAQIATELGYEICRSHFPPVIMLSLF